MLLNLQPMTSQAQRPASCRVEGCSAPHRARGLCGTHYQADRRGRGLVQAEDSRRPCSHDGCDRGFWAKGLCRLHYLWSTRGYSESCTHNGCAERTYRRNLCGKSSQPPGQRVEDKLQWAREILALYGGTHSDPSH